MASDYVAVVGSMANKIFVYVMWLVLIVVILLVLWAVYYFLTYKNKAIVFDSQRRDAGKIVRFKILHNKGIIKFFMTVPNKMLVPHADCFVPFRRSASFLAVEKNGEFFMPLRISPNPGFLNSAGEFSAIKLYQVQDARRTEEVYAKKQSFAMMMAPWAAFMVLAIIFLLIVIFVFKKVGTGGGVAEGPGMIQRIGGTLMPGSGA